MTQVNDPVQESAERWVSVGEAVLLDALEMMVEQYMHLDENGIYHHDFMSTGEYVSTLLPERRPETWEKHRLGLRRRTATRTTN